MWLIHALALVCLHIYPMLCIIKLEQHKTYNIIENQG